MLSFLFLILFYYCCPTSWKDRKHECISVHSFLTNMKRFFKSSPTHNLIEKVFPKTARHSCFYVMYLKQESEVHLLRTFSTDRLDTLMIISGSRMTVVCVIDSESAPKDQTVYQASDTQPVLVGRINSLLGLVFSWDLFSIRKEYLSSLKS